MKIKAFSLVELMISLIVISLLLVAFMPVLTKRTKKSPVVVKTSDSVPIGSIIYWLGENYPDGWMPLDGQDISSDEYSELRNVIGNSITNLPDYNLFDNQENSVTMIIKYRKKGAKNNQPTELK